MKSTRSAKLLPGVTLALALVSSAAAQGTCATAIDFSSEVPPLASLVQNAAGDPGSTVSCAVGSESGPDVWIRLPDLVVGMRYAATTSAGDDQTVEDTRLAIFLGECGSQTEVACSEDLGDTPFGAVEFEATETGPWFAFAETLAADAVGSWLFTFQEAAAAPAGSGCGSPASLAELDLPSESQIDMSGGFDARSVSCAAGGDGGADAWFVLPQFPDGDLVVLSVSPIAGADLPAVRMEVFAGTDCSSLSPIACGSESGAAIGFVADGSTGHLLFVEYADAAQEGPFLLSVETLPLAGGQFCGEAVSIGDAGLPTSASVDLSDARSFAVADCAPTGSTGPERWFELSSLVAGELVTVSLADGGAAPGNAVLQLFEGPDCASLLPRACVAEGDAAGGPFHIDFVPAAGQHYFVLVDGIDPVGTLVFDLSLSTSGPLVAPDFDSCDAAFSFSSGDLPLSGSNSVLAATDSGLFVPDGAAAGGVDVFYAFTVSGTGRYRFEGGFEGEGLDVSLGVWSGADCNSLVPLCGGPISGAEPVVVAELVDRQLYFVTLDDPDPSSVPSSYSLSVELLTAEAPSANGDCVSALEVSSLPFEDAQDPTWNASALEVSSILGLSGCLGELYYELVPVADSTIRVHVESADGTGGVLALFTGGCAAPALQQGPWLNDALFDLDAGVPAVLVVEQTHFAAGELAVAIEDIPRPGNQTCETAIVIDGTPYDALAEFVNARDEGIDGTCALDPGSLSRRDLFWTFTPASTGNYRVQAVPADPDAYPVDTSIVLFTGNCDNLAEMACRDFTLSGEMLVAELAAGIPVTIMVEVAEPAGIPGSQPVSISVTAIEPSSGSDLCEQAQDVVVGESPFGESIDIAGNNPVGYLFDGPVHIYRLQAPGDGEFHLDATPGEPGLDIALAVLADSCDPDYIDFFAGDVPESVSDGNGPASKGVDGAESLDVPVLAGESFLLHVFSVTPSGGNVAVSFSFEPKIVEGEDFWMLH